MLRKYFALIIPLLATAALAQNNPVQPVPALTDSRVSDAIRKQLEPGGYRVSTADGPVDVWLRAQVPTGKNPVDGATYDKLTESTLVGVIQFAKDSRDYKGLHIPAGIYTMRYEVQPDDGNHLGTAPTRDFLLLMPPDADTDPSAVYDFQKMVALSSRVNGTNKHPTPLNLVAPETKRFPTADKDSEDHTILNVQVKTATGYMPIALVVKGTAAQ